MTENAITIICIGEIVNNRKSKWLRIVLGIVIAFDIIVMLAALLGSGTREAFHAIVFLPLLIPAYRMAGINTHIGEIVTHLEKNGDSISVKQDGVILEKDGDVARKYSFVHFFTEYNDSEHIAYIRGSGEITFLCGDSVVDSASFEGELLSLRAKDESEFERLKAYLGGL